jgi:hypothetical protein
MNPRIAKILPSKHFRHIGAVVLATAAVFILVSFVFGDNSSYKKDKEAVEVSSTRLVSVLYEDNDGDGILNWEESLWGTNPDKSDTDGDGISDKEEIEQKRQEIGVEDTTETEENRTQTSILSRELIASIVALNKSGSLTQGNLESIAAELGEAVDKSFFDMFSEKDIETIAFSRDNFDTYIEETDAIYLSYSDTNIQQELFLIPGFLEDPVSTQIEIEQVAQDYKDMAEDLSQVEVPENISAIHLDLINTFGKIGQSIDEFVYINDDPLRALGGISSYQKNNEKIFDLLRIIDISKPAI